MAVFGFSMEGVEELTRELNRVSDSLDLAGDALEEFARIEGVEIVRAATPQLTGQLARAWTVAPGPVRLSGIADVTRRVEDVTEALGDAEDFLREVWIVNPEPYAAKVLYHPQNVGEYRAALRELGDRGAEYVEGAMRDISRRR